MESSNNTFLQDAPSDPTRGAEDHTTDGPVSTSPLDGIGETRTDHHGQPMEDFKTQGMHDDSDEKLSDQNHIHNVIAHHASDPMLGGSEIDFLVSPHELSLRPITFASRHQTQDHNSIVTSYVVNNNNDNNNHMMILPYSSHEAESNEATLSHPMVDAIPDVTIRSMQDTLDVHKCQGDDSLFSSHALLDGIILPSPEEVDHSNEAGPEDAKTDDHAIQISDHMLPHQRIISCSVESPRFIKQGSFNRGHIDTAAPIESVKDAVSKFGGIVDWKVHKVQSIERRKLVEQGLDKIQEEMPEYKKRSEQAEEAKVKVLKELDNTKRSIEELKVSLERAQTEENQARQDSELALLRMKEREQGIDDEASVVAKKQLEVAKARHEAAVLELKSVRDDLEAIRKDYVSLMVECDVAAKKSEEAVFDSKEVEKRVQDMTIELITTKEYLEAAHAAHLESEERRIVVAMARDQDTLQWKKELKQSEEEIQRITQQVNLTNELKSKLETASALLLDLEGELAESEAWTLERKPHTDMQAAIDSAKKELDEMKHNIERAKMEVESLKTNVDSLKSELEKEKSKAGELQRAEQEAEKAKSLVHTTRLELRKAKEEAEQVKDEASTVESRLLVAQGETEAARVSKNLALAAIKALRASESDQNIDVFDVTLCMEEYYDLSKRAYDAETRINTRMEAVDSRIEAAKKSQSMSLEKLEEVNREMSERKEAQRLAKERADKANEGKLHVEQELRKLRAEHGQQRMAHELDHGGDSPNNIEHEASHAAGTNDAVTEPTPEQKAAKKKKKKSIIPKIFMFLSRKKSKA